MKKSNIAGKFCLISGVVLLLSALLLLVHNFKEDKQAGKAAQNVLPEIQNIISNRVQAKKTPLTVPLTPSPVSPTDVLVEKEPAKEEEVKTNNEMSAATIDGSEYIGYLSIPVLDLELPVMSKLSYPNLKISPCREYGSAESNDLVIAAHNYKRHFGRLNQLVCGDHLSFTDMNGTVNNYEITEVKVISPTSIEEVRSTDYDLVLYTCTYGGKSRVMVGCKAVFFALSKEDI